MQVSVLTIDTSGEYWQGFSKSRMLRIEYPGAIYHVMNRGDQREDIFRDDQDRQKFLSTHWPRLALRPSGRCMRTA